MSDDILSDSMDLDTGDDAGQSPWAPGQPGLDDADTAFDSQVDTVDTDTGVDAHTDALTPPAPGSVSDTDDPGPPPPPDGSDPGQSPWAPGQPGTDGPEIPPSIDLGGVDAEMPPHPGAISDPDDLTPPPPPPSGVIPPHEIDGGVDVAPPPPPGTTDDGDVSQVPPPPEVGDGSDPSQTPWSSDQPGLATDTSTDGGIDVEVDASASVSTVCDVLECDPSSLVDAAASAGVTVDAVLSGDDVDASVDVLVEAGVDASAEPATLESLVEEAGTGTMVLVPVETDGSLELFTLTGVEDEGSVELQSPAGARFVAPTQYIESLWTDPRVISAAPVPADLAPATAPVAVPSATAGDDDHDDDDDGGISLPGPLGFLLMPVRVALEFLREVFD